jgi:hypothetical protein
MNFASDDELEPDWIETKSCPTQILAILNFGG